MLLPRLPAMPASTELPLWPPLLATRGPGGRSAAHAHHAMHLVLALDGALAVTSPSQQSAAGVLTAPDATHAIDASGTDVMLVFIDPESDVGAALRPTIVGALRTLSEAERDALVRDAEPMAIMREGGAAWTSRAVAVLGASPVAAVRRVHPRVRKVLRLLRDGERETSLDALAADVGLSAGRLMHVFTESTGIPLRPYLVWLKLQRAAAAIASRVPLGEAAHAAGFADSAHMTRTFRRMLGVPPSTLRPR